MQNICLLSKEKPEPDVFIEEAEAMLRYIISGAYRSDILSFDDNEQGNRESGAYARLLLSLTA